MVAIISRSSFSHELISLIGSAGHPVVLNTLMTTVSGIDPDHIYQDQTEPPFVLVLENGRQFELNDTDYDWYLNIKYLAENTFTVSGQSVSFSTDENEDPVFTYNWQYGDNSITGNYEAQVYGISTADSKILKFETVHLTVRPRI